MLYEPTLQVREVAIYRGPAYVYQAAFHKGVNIITGENSSGKSTILNLIVYGLGGDIASWSEHAKLCERVSIEVSLNANIVTLSRLISSQSGQPMEIYLGNLKAAESAPVSDWLRYPYRSTSARESFSQAVFNLLSIPELKTEATGKLTLHQILRLLYSDQLSAVERIFRDDDFDSPSLREAVGRLLFGAYDSEIYANQLKIKEFEKELSIVDSALRSIYTILSGVDHSLTLDWVEAERRKIENELTRARTEITEAEREVYFTDSTQALSLQPQRQALVEVQKLQSELGAQDDQIQALELEFADSEIFITTLQRKIKALQDSSLIASNISGVQYASCPSCYAPIATSENPFACHLCKEPFDEERLRRRIAGQLNQMLLQLKQSQGLQSDRSKALNSLSQRRVDTQAKWEAASLQLGRVRESPTSEGRNKLRLLNERFGYLSRELEGMAEKASLIRRLDTMSRQKVDLNEGIAGLTERNERLKASEATRLAKANTAVADETVFFLHRDLPRQDSFQNARSVNFSFAKNEITVDGQAYFSASSTVYLKNAFLSAFLFCAARDPHFRHLRLLILDTIEDKGMEPARSQNFQQLLVDQSASIEAEHQIIFATAMINPSLNTSNFVVGAISTHQRRTLLLNS